MQTGSLVNLVAGRSGNAHGTVEPVVGMGATQLGWTDRHPYTVVEILGPKRIRVQADTATRTDKNGMSESQDYTYAPNPDGATYILKLLKRGWQAQAGGNVFALGYRQEYYDYSF